MKILHLTPAYLPAYRYGGPIASVHTLNKWLVKKGADVTVYTTNIDGKNDLPAYAEEPKIIDGVKVFYFPVTFRPWFYSFKLHRALAETVKDFDVVHTTSVFLAASTLGACYAKKFNIPYVISPRGNLMKEPLARKNRFKKIKKKIYIEFLEKRNLKNAGAIHFTSELEEKEYLESNLPKRKSFVIPNSFDKEDFKGKEAVSPDVFRRRLGIDSNKKIILFLGRISWKKGFDILIPAFSALLEKEPETILAIVGGDDEGYKKEVQSLIKQNDIKEGANVYFTDMLLKEDRIAAYKGSNVFVLPTYSENFAMTVVEAMSFGLPPIVTDATGIAMVIERAGAGIVIKSGDRKREIKELTDKMLVILMDKKKAQEMGEKGKDLVQKEFSPESVADQFIKAYNDLIKNHGHKTGGF